MHCIYLPHAGILFRITHAGLEALGLAEGHTLSAPTLPLLHALGVVRHWQTGRALGLLPGTEGLLLTSGEVGGTAFRTGGHEIAA